MCFCYLWNSCPKHGASKFPGNYTTDTGATEVPSSNLCVKFFDLLHMNNFTAIWVDFSVYLGLNYMADGAFLIEVGFLNDHIHPSSLYIDMEKEQNFKSTVRTAHDQ